MPNLLRNSKSPAATKKKLNCIHHIHSLKIILAYMNVRSKWNFSSRYVHKLGSINRKQVVHLFVNKHLK